MAVPIFSSCSISISPHLFFDSSIPRSSRNYYMSCTPSSSSSELSPVRLEVSLTVGTHLIPHPNKIEKGGEDAFLVSSYNGGVLAIADGVSGWAEQNIDPALFPRELMSNASNLVDDEEVNYDPQVLIKKAHAATSSVGSATVIVAMLEKNGMLKVANVGDCGLKILRQGYDDAHFDTLPWASMENLALYSLWAHEDWLKLQKRLDNTCPIKCKVIFSTSPQEHYFDCPYQLCSQMIGQTYLDAMISKMELMEGDIIVMGSDGLFDNVFDYEIVSTISRFKDVEEAAKALANLANFHSMDTNFESPYILEARSKGYDVPLWKKILGKKLTGGKLDDVTVIVSQVVSL